MTLADWLKWKNVKPREFDKRVKEAVRARLLSVRPRLPKAEVERRADKGCGRSMIWRYVNHRRIPDRDTMIGIWDVTDGAVTPNDFYADIRDLAA